MRFSMILNILIIIITATYSCHSDNIILNSEQRKISMREFSEIAHNTEIIYFGVDKDEISEIFYDKYGKILFFHDFPLEKGRKFSDKLLDSENKGKLETVNITFPEDIIEIIAEKGLDGLDLSRKILIPDIKKDETEKSYYFELFKYKIPKIRKFNMKIFENHYDSKVAQKEYSANLIAGYMNKKRNFEKTIVLCEKDRIINGFGIPERQFRRNEHSYIRIIPVLKGQENPFFFTQTYSDIIWLKK